MTPDRSSFGPRRARVRRAGLPSAGLLLAGALLAAPGAPAFPAQTQPSGAARHSLRRSTPGAPEIPSDTAPAQGAGAPPMAPADADMQVVLDTLRALGPRPVTQLTPDEARRQPGAAAAAKRVLLAMGRDTAAPALVAGVTSADGTIRGADGPLPVTVYTPAGPGPFPVVVYFHGGGWVVADRRGYDGGARGLAKQADAVVVSVDYRRAPEAKFPAQHDDALAAYRYVATHAAAFGGDGRRFALAGESAGGNLAVATAVAARDAGVTPPRAVLAVYPIAQGDTTTASYAQYAAARPLGRAAMTWFFTQATRTPADRQDPRIALVRADLRGLPPVTIINAELDPLRDDGALLERALRAAGGRVERRVFSGVPHQFFGLAAVVGKAWEAQAYAGQRLRTALRESFGSRRAGPGWADRIPHGRR